MNHEHVRRHRAVAGTFNERGAARNCAGCIDFALEWYDDLMRAFEQPLGRVA